MFGLGGQGMTFNIRDSMATRWAAAAMLLQTRHALRKQWCCLVAAQHEAQPAPSIPGGYHKGPPGPAPPSWGPGSPRGPQTACGRRRGRILLVGAEEEEEGWEGRSSGRAGQQRPVLPSRFCLNIPARPALNMPPTHTHRRRAYSPLACFRLHQSQRGRGSRRLLS